MDLTDKQRAFVIAYVDAGGRNATAAARKAGYSHKIAHVTACNLLKDDKILEAVGQETLKRMAANVPVAQAILLQLAKTAKSESVKLQAAQALLDRGGLQIAQKFEHLFKSDNRSDEEIERENEMLRKELEKSQPKVTLQ